MKRIIIDFIIEQLFGYTECYSCKNGYEHSPSSCDNLDYTRLFRMLNKLKSNEALVFYNLVKSAKH